LANIIGTIKNIARRFLDLNQLDQWLAWNAGIPLGGGSVTPDAAMTTTAVFACVRVLGETVGSLPLHVYKKTGKMVEIARDYPLYKVLHDRPNPRLSSMGFREMLTGHMALRGNGYAKIIYDGQYRTKALYPIHPGRIKPMLVDGEKVYRVTMKNGSTEIWPEEMVLHLPALNYDGLEGYSPITVCNRTMRITRSAEEYDEAFFTKGATLDGFIRHPSRLSPDARGKLKKYWEENHTGVKNYHGIGVLDEGMEWQNVGLNPADAQLLSTREFQLEEIARMFRIPLHMIQDMKGATFSNIEQQSLDFLIHTMTPWLVRWEQEMNYMLIPERDYGKYYIKFNVNGLLRADTKTRYESYASAKQNGWMSANDIRELEDKNPVEGGDVYLVAVNMMPSTDVGKIPESNETVPGVGDVKRDLDRKDVEHRAREPITRLRLRESYRGLFADAAGRLTRKEVNDIGRAAKSYLPGDTSGFSDWVTGYYGDGKLQDYLKKNFAPVVNSYAEEIYAAAEVEAGIGAEGMTAERQVYADGYVDVLAARHAGESRGQMEAIIADGEQPDEAIPARLAEWEEKQPDKMAEREVVDGDGAFTSLVFLAAGLKLVWRTRGDSCPYCTSLNGKVISGSESFAGDGDEIDPEGGNGPMIIHGIKKHPQLHRGCDCYIGYEV